MNIKLKAKVYEHYSTVYSKGTSEERESMELDAAIGKIPIRLFSDCCIVDVTPKEIKI